MYDPFAIAVLSRSTPMNPARSSATQTATKPALPCGSAAVTTRRDRGGAALRLTPVRDRGRTGASWLIVELLS